MQRVYEPLTRAFRNNRGFLNYEKFYKVVNSHCEIMEDSFMIAELLKASGYPIEEKLNGYIFKPIFTNYIEQEYVVVDIETNGAKPGYAQVIEIGALKVKNGKIIDKFESFVSCTYLPDTIIELTGITPKDLKDAPSRKVALTKLRAFLGDAIFVAHNVEFDYNFLSASFERFGLGNIGNLKICTIELAKKTIQAPKYGLAGLCDFLGIDMKSHHRAYSDALCSWQIMQKSLKKLPSNVVTSDDLVLFASSSLPKRKKNSKQNRRGR
jgi:DNA polymerase-3 subunit epsilon